LAEVHLGLCLLAEERKTPAAFAELEECLLVAEMTPAAFAELEVWLLVAEITPLAFAEFEEQVEL